MALERLQKILARVGVASRRKAEDMIRLGEVTINGRMAKLGDQADAIKDAIKVRGKLLTAAKKHVPHVYLAFHKPRGVISMVAPDPEGRPTLANFLGQVHARVFPVGRLDYNGEGIVLLTNDGELAEAILKHPEIIRTYEVKLKGHPTAQDLDALRKGARVEGHFVKPKSVEVAQELTSKARIRLQFVGMGALDVKEYLQAKGHLVERVIRTRLGHLSIEKLPAGAFTFLRKSQVEALVKQPALGVLQPQPELPVQNKEGGRQRAEARREAQARETAQALGTSAPRAPRPQAKTKGRPGGFKGKPKGGPKGGPRGSKSRGFGAHSGRPPATKGSPKSRRGRPGRG
ncbi:MAG TPA: S4 domain-containing protein [Bdellovibrionota bacterium]|nr:S4 domain-containing protein [Bdellovibrionota bacterium]